jgi:hypothetical protein
MIRPFAIAILLSLASGTARAQACRDIRQFNFKNAAIPIAAPDDGGRSGPDLFHLHDGAGFLSDDPDSAQSHDWGLQLIADRLAHPDPSTWIRVIVVDKDHLTGTGDWRYVMVFGCRNGSLVSIFQYGSEGVELKHLSDQRLDLYQAVWTKDDAHCCPSRHVDIVYRWDTQQHRYRKAISVSGPGSTPRSDKH